MEKDLSGAVIVGLAARLLTLRNHDRLIWSRVGKCGEPLPCGQQDLEILFERLRAADFKGRATLRIDRDGTGSIEWSL